MLLPAILAQALAALPTPSTASEAGGPAPVVHVTRTVLQTRYQQSAVSIAPALEQLVEREFPSPSVAADSLRAIRDTARGSDGLSLRRAWLELESEPVRGIRGEVRLDFAPLFHEEEPLEMLEVFAAELAPSDEFAVTVGLFEIPFSLFELVHDPRFELAEKGPTYELLEHLGFAGSDVGALIQIDPWPAKRWLQLSLGAVNAGAMGGQEHRVLGLLASRLLIQPFEALRLGGSFACRPYPVQTWWEEYRFYYQASDSGSALAADASLTLGDFVLRAEWLFGDRTDNDVPSPLLQRRGSARTFMGAWGMALLRLPLGAMHVVPAARAEYIDVDREHGDVGGIVHLSAALGLELSPQWRLLWDLSQHYVQAGTRNWNFDIVRYDVDTTTGTVQLQVEL